MKRLFKIFAMLVVGFALAAPVGAAEFGTADEAVALAKKAIAYVKEVGVEKAAAEFTNDTTGKWKDRDLYITLVDKDGIRLAHGMNPKLVGKSYLESVDVTGKAFGKEGMEGGATKGSGWVDYMFKDPLSQKQLPKTSYYEKSGEYLYVVGIYKR